MKRTRRRRPGHSERQRAWNASPQAAAARREGREAARSLRGATPKCGAKRKEDGLPCQNPGLENGRCRLHGGLTPKGDNWHRVRWPNPDAPPEKLAKKLAELDRRRRKRAARIAAMSPEERERFERQSRARRPSSVAAREAKRRNREAKALLANAGASAPPPSPEEAALAAEIERLKELKARLEAGADGRDR